MSYRDLYTIAHNYAIHAIPGALGAFDMGDIAIACLPRPIQIQVGENEPEFWGRHRDTTHSEFSRILNTYDSHGSVAELHITPGGGHSFDTQAAVRFLDAHL